MNSSKAPKYGGFEQYTRPIERFIDKISFTIKGRIGFNKSIDAKYNLRQYDRVILYWNEAERQIGIEFLKGTVDSPTLKLLVDKRGFGVHLNALNFFQTYNIDLGKIKGQYSYRKVSAKKYGIERSSIMLIIKLPDN